MRRLDCSRVIKRAWQRAFSSLASRGEVNRGYPPKALESSSTLLGALPRLEKEVSRFDVSVPVEQASTPPSSWCVYR
jgi:hypothetical protein